MSLYIICKCRQHVSKYSDINRLLNTKKELQVLPGFMEIILYLNVEFEVIFTKK